jgi:hypothetical protein
MLGANIGSADIPSIPTAPALSSPSTGPLRGANHAYHGAPPFGFPRGIGCADVIHFAASP